MGILQKHIAALPGLGGLSTGASKVRAVAVPGIRELREAPSGWVGMRDMVPMGCGCSDVWGTGGTGEAGCWHPSPRLNFPAVKCIRSKAEYFAERLYKAMKVSGFSLLYRNPPVLQESGQRRGPLATGRSVREKGDTSP